MMLTPEPRFEPPDVGGVVYNRAALMQLRDEVIEMRDHATTQNAFGAAVVLTHVVGVLYHVAEWLPE